MQHSYLKVFTKSPVPGEENTAIIPQIDNIEMLDFIMVIKGTLLLEFNETDAETNQERVQVLQPQTGYIHPIKTPRNQNAKSLRMAPFEETVICMIIERVKFRKILFSVNYFHLNFNRTDLSLSRR
jgi:hypothetical protein